MIDPFSDPTPKQTNADRYRFKDGAHMRDYQIRAAHKIFTGTPVRNRQTGQYTGQERDGTAIHVDVGLGKTIIGLTAIADMFEWGIISKPVLVIAPIKVCETVWRQEARDWSHTCHLTFQLLRGNEKERAFAQARQSHIHLINPELLQWLQTHIRADWGAHYDALIIDESSMFKDKNSKRFKVLTNYGTRMTLKGPDGKSLIDPNTGEKIIVPPHRFKRSAIMTGTPSPNGLRSLWSPFYIIDHGARLHKKFDTYLGRFFHKAGKLAPHIDKYELNDGEGEARPLWEIRDGGPQRIHELIADVTVELNAADYGILPKVLPPFLHYVDLPNEVMQHYKVLEKEALFEMLENPILASNGGAKSMMCWQICNGAIHVTDEYGKRSWKELHSAKLDKLIEIVETLNQNCLIPYYFTHDRDRITARFRKEGIPYTIMPSKNAQDVIDRWNAGRIENLLIHPQSAAHGLNLQFGGYTLIWFSTIWSLERWIQTNGRLGRSGQKGIVSIHIIMANKTTDAARMLSLTINGDEQTRLRQSVLQYQRGMGIDIESIPLPASRNSPFEGVEL